MQQPCVKLAAMIVLSVGAAAGAHPAHFSFATVEWNAESAVLEVALRMEAATLERALRRIAKENNHLGRANLALDSPEAEESVQQYLLPRFEVKTSQGDLAAIQWVGFEASLLEAWAYFEVPVSGDPDGLVFQNRILFEIEPEQVNVVNVIAGNRAGTVKLTSEEPKHSVSLTVDK